MPGIRTRGVIPPFLRGGEVYNHVGDFGWSEHLGAQGIYSSLAGSSVVIQFVQNNLLRFYLFTLVVWLLLLVALYFHSLFRA